MQTGSSRGGRCRSLSSEGTADRTCKSVLDTVKHRHAIQLDLLILRGSINVNESALQYIIIAISLIEQDKHTSTLLVAR